MPANLGCPGRLLIKHCCSLLCATLASYFSRVEVMLSEDYWICCKNMMLTDVIANVCLHREMASMSVNG